MHYAALLDSVLLPDKAGLDCLLGWKAGDGVREEGLIQFKCFILLEPFISAAFSRS